MLNQNCWINNHCSAIPNAECSDYQCECKVGYVESNPTTCSPLLGTQCTKLDECAVRHSICFDGQCECSDFFTPQSNDRCRSTLLQKTCETDRDCVNIKFSYCSASNLCSCIRNNIALNGSACGGLLNQYCSHDLPCVTENSVCVNNNCECKFFFKNSDAKCFPRK
ncbi:fibrillin-2-like [Cotesia glomerata]|uniref:fibrillin-2-like n=1 Tax=Cotesia glomerata TaxID=32391 RepID=UPI001D035028|nr:fibrillin-2-like [Cotesia glomerata]